MYGRHLESLRKKLTSRVALLRRLACSGWGAGATTLRTATLDLVYSTTEYCAPVWCRSAHTCLIDTTINDALRNVTGCLRPTPVDNLPIHAGIQPAELRRRGATLSLGLRAMEPGHLLHSALTRTPGAAARRLKSRHPFNTPHKNPSVFLKITTYMRRSGPIINKVRSGWTTPQDLNSRHRYTHTHGMTLPRRAWVRLNRLCTGVGRFDSCLYKWGMASSATCECGTEQTVDHVILHCPIHRPPWTTRPDGSGR